MRIGGRRRILGLIALLGLVVSVEVGAQETTGDWSRHQATPVLTPQPEQVPRHVPVLAADPSIIFEPGRENPYRMWFGHEWLVEAYQIAGAWVGHAESPNGIDGWTNWRYALVPVGPAGAWDDRNVETPTVLLDPREPVGSQRRYQMWYSGFKRDGEEYRIGYAESPDGFQWRKAPARTSPVRPAGLVLDWGCADELGWQWCEIAVTDPSVVLREDGTYHMWFSMIRLTDVDGTAVADGGIGYATSRDGINWTRQNAGNPVLRGSGWDARWADPEHPSNRIAGWPAQPHVIWNGRFYEMWYSAGHYNNDRVVPRPRSNQAMGYAVSDDGIVWSKLDRPILVPEESCGWLPGVAALHQSTRTLLYYPVVTEVRRAEEPSATCDGPGPFDISRISLFLATRRRLPPPSETTGLAPAGTVTDPRPTFRWNAVRDANWYRLRIDDLRSPWHTGWYTAREVGCESGTGICSVTPDRPLALGAWQWHVRARNPDGDAPWSPAVPFRVVAAPLTVTSLTADLSPPQPPGVPITWTAVVTGGVAPVQYRWWVSDGTTWTATPDWSTSNTFVLRPTAPGRHRVLVWIRSAGSVVAYEAYRYGTPDPFVIEAP